MTFDQFVLPVGLLFLGAIGAVIADRAARFRRRPVGERGDYWTRVARRVCLFLALPVLISGAAALVRSYWLTGRHLFFDITGVFGWPPDRCYHLALLIPFAVWALLLMFGVMVKPAERETARWLAGAIGFGNSRLWVIAWTLPLALVMAMMLSDLGGGAGAYPAAAWSMQAVLLLSLFGVAFSTGDPVTASAPASGKPDQAAPALRPWPDALAAHGVQVKTLASWPAIASDSNVRPSAGDLNERLRIRGATGVAPELVEAVDGLLGATGEEHRRTRLIVAPDDCGEVEVVALAAEVLDQRFHAATLVLTAGNSEALAARFEHWLPGRRVAAVNVKGEIDSKALIIVADAQILSDRLLSHFKNPAILERFGLIVWWHLEAYTGVLAANLWAISRRLHRLLAAMGRHDLRTLAFVRNSPHGHAQIAAFVRRLLPHPFPSESVRHVHTAAPRSVHLHLLESHERFLESEAGRSLQERDRHLSLVATKVSVSEGWPTHLDVPADISQAEAGAFLQVRIGGVELSERLARDGASAGACVREVLPGEALSLMEIIGHSGRAAAAGLPHHVGITRPWNPYVAHLLSTLSGTDGSARFEVARRLVSAEAQPSVVRRHLLLALDELPDTEIGLLKNFLWNKDVIRGTLREIANEGKLTRKAVRFLDDHNELRPDHEYGSQRAPGGERRPLNTVGNDLIEVRDLAGGFDPDEGVQMLVDPERLTIEAYPHRRFVHRGQRYRILEWASIEEAQREHRVVCQRDSVYSLTWRIRHASVFDIKPRNELVGVGRGSKLLTRVAVTLRYEEDVSGALRLLPSLTGGEPKVERHQLGTAIAQGFQTRAILIKFPQEESPVALASLAQALRHMLPVHVGVEEDALDVVSLTGQLVDGRPAFGLAIVDLYPGGIGLVDAIGDDNMLLLQMLEWAKDWLDSCPCRSDKGCPSCLRSVAALAANSDLLPTRSAALNLLRQMV